MVKQKSIFLCICVISSFSALGQNSAKITFSNSTMGSTEDGLPFWFWANRDGMVKPGVSFLNFTDVGAEISGHFKNNKDWQYSAGTDLVGAFGSESYTQINQMFAAVDYKGWRLEGGMFRDELGFGGLSTSNGNLARSRNARPVPGIRISTSEYKPVPGLRNWDWLSFRFEYDEGFLNDERYVDDAHLHHKSLYLGIQPAENWDIQLGVEHFVMWGGTSRNEKYGHLPDDFKAYLKYILGDSGGENFPETDQKNIAGNQYGTYQLKVSGKFTGYTATVNISHPFEDYSGVNWRNWNDNLIGLYLEFNDQQRFITDIIYEFTRTKQQGITGSLYKWDEEKQEWERLPADNYYNHGVYNSGVTYHKMAMSSPLFFPVIITDGISRGFRSNRLSAHHIGVKGRFLPYVYWKGLATCIKHFGTYSSPYDSPEKQFSLLGELNYKNPAFPFNIGISVGADMGKDLDNCYGAQLTISKTWSKN